MVVQIKVRLEKQLDIWRCILQSDWNDGKVLSEMVRSLGGSAAAPEKLRSDPAYWEQNQNQAVEAGKRLGERIFR